MSQTHTKRKRRRAVAIACIALGAILLLVGSYTVYLYIKADSAIQKMAAPERPSPAPSGTTDIAGGSPEAGAPGTESPGARKSLTFLLAGIDSRAGSGGTLNTDVLMLATLNTETHTASLLSIPRDLQLKPKTLKSHKANYYYAYFYNQDKETAIANTKAFYSELFDFPIDYMVLINFDGLRQLVDAVGGITVDVDMDMKYRDTADGTDIDLKKGVQKLSGKQTLDFVRYRKSNEGTQESSDIARNGRQQQVLTQIVDKLASFKGMTQWGNVLDIMGNNVKTDVPEDELRSWIMNFQQMKPARTTMIPLETRWENPYIVVKEDTLRQALERLRSEAGLPEDDRLQLADVVGVDSSADDSSLE